MAWRLCLGLLALAALTTPAEVREAETPLASYRVLVIKPFTVAESAAAKGYPGGYETWLEEQTFFRLRYKNLFHQVLRPTEASASPRQGLPERCLLLSGAILAYDKGSRALRLMTGFGPGAGRVKARFVFHDAVTGKEVFRTVRQGKFYGYSDLGGGEEHAMVEAGGDVIDGLIKDMKQKGGLTR